MRSYILCSLSSFRLPVSLIITYFTTLWRNVQCVIIIFFNAASAVHSKLRPRPFCYTCVSEKEWWGSGRLYVEIHKRHHISSCTFRFSHLNSLKRGHQRFYISEFSFVWVLRTIFMQHFLEDGLAEKVKFHCRPGALIWHPLISTFGLCTQSCLHSKHSKPSIWKKESKKPLSRYREICYSAYDKKWKVDRSDKQRH